MVRLNPYGAVILSFRRCPRSPFLAIQSEGPPKGGDPTSKTSIDRRTFLKGAGLAALAATAGIDIRESHADEPVPYSSGTEAPKLKAPANACDCHMHIYDSRFPVAPTATLRPPNALPSDYRLLQKRIGTTRNVIVQPSTYGTDNRCTLDAMAQIGPTARAVAVVDTTVSDAELQRLAGLGVRGIRFNLVQAGATTVDMIEPLSAAGERTRLARADPHARRPDRADRESAAAAALADRVRSHGPHPSARRGEPSRIPGRSASWSTKAGPGSSCRGRTWPRRSDRRATRM